MSTYRHYPVARGMAAMGAKQNLPRLCSPVRSQSTTVLQRGASKDGTRLGIKEVYAKRIGPGYFATKSNPNNPYGEDDSAAQNLPAGYATDGCTK
jgi:hypothetical protein